MNKRRITAAAVVATTALGAVLAVPTTASAATASKPVPNSKPAWTAHTKALGATSAKAAINARVYLAPRGGLAALAAEAKAMSTPGNAEYHHFLTSSQYVAKYAPTADQVAAVSAYLKSEGLKVGSVGAQNRYISVSGSVAAANKAFNTKIYNYKHNGQSVQANASALSLPNNIAVSVLTVTGVDTTQTLMKSAAVTPPAGFRNARPCSIYSGQILAKYKADYTTPLPTFAGKTLPYAPCGYTGPQLRAAYEGNTNMDGSGVTVAITDAYASATLASDTNRYAATNGDGSFAPGQFVQSIAKPFTHASLCGPSGWSGEQSLDVEAVHAVAPGANIHYYGAQSCEDNDLLAALAQVVVDDTAQLVTNSWGSPSEAESADSIPAYEGVFLQGAVQGQSFMFSSGDNGDELANTAIKQVDYPTSDPYVTSVGGTSSRIGARGQMLGNSGWGTVKYSLSADGNSWTSPTWLYGAGGGASTEFNTPWYQVGTTPGAYRTVPDVAMDADPNTGMLIGLTQTFPDGTYYDQYRIGGTSLASPLFAGLTALSLEHGGTAVGLLNPLIYDNQAAFSDVVNTPGQPGDVRVDFANSVDGSAGLKYSVRTFGQDSSLQVKTGYDEVTGVGAGTPAWVNVLPAPSS